MAINWKNVQISEKNFGKICILTMMEKFCPASF